MQEDQEKIKKLEAEVELYKSQIEKITTSQQDASKLLIRRDLALSRANEKLQELDQAKSEFISVAAHQLRTPLSAIKWIIHMIAHDEFKDLQERTDFIQKAADSTDRMIALVNDLLEVDHIQSGKDQFVFKKVELSPLVGSIVSEVATLATNKNISVEYIPDEKVTVVGDTLKLRALFQNLIDNAVKYTPVGGKVKIEVKNSDTCAEVYVSDSGIGIPEDQKSQIFTKFFRAPNAMKTETVGSGLGLFIANEIVKRHGGKLDFKSKIGEGTTFSVRLPLSVTGD